MTDTATIKMKLRVGDHEFEAEGPADVIDKQFAAFKELIGAVQEKKAAEPAKEKETTEQQQNAPTPHAELSRIFKVSDRIISLTVPPKSWEDAQLALLYAQQILRSNEAVTGAELREGLKQSGYPEGRTDRVMEKFSNEGLVITIGQRRASRYRLTNQGFAKADGIAAELLATLPR